MTPSGNGRKKTKKRKRKQSYNPHLKAIMLEIVGNQLRQNNPPEARETYERLQREFPTGALAVLTFDVDRWLDIAPLRARLDEFTTPTLLASTR